MKHPDEFGLAGGFKDAPLAQEISENSRRMAALRNAVLPHPQTPRIITVSNQKGGVGKTTTAVNLAAALADKGLEVLVVDLDPQGNASTALGIEHRIGVKSIYEVITQGVPLSEVVQVSPESPRVRCVPATIDLATAELELVSLLAREFRLKNALADYISTTSVKPDYVFIDCPPSLGLLTVNAFTAATEVLIPIQCEYYALEGLSQLKRSIDMIRSALNPNLSLSTILLTMYDSRTKLNQAVVDDVRSHFPTQTLQTLIPRQIGVAEAPSYGQTVINYDRSSNGAISYMEAAMELANRGVING